MRRILVVDGDPHVRRAMHVRLEQHGFRVSTADGGPAGLAAPGNGSLGLTIVDVLMPKVRGLRGDPAVSRAGTDGGVDRPSRSSLSQTVARLGAVAEAAMEPQAKRKPAEIEAMPSEARRADRAGGRA